MKKVDNENVDLVLSQKSLFEKVQKINRLFKIHFETLSFFLSMSIGNIIFLISMLLTGQIVTELTQRYGLFGMIFDIIQLIVLILMLFYFTYQISVYYSFVIKGNRSIRNIEQKDSNVAGHQTSYSLRHGIVSYINNVSTFFNRYSKEKSNLSNRVAVFLYMNFFFGFLIIIFILRLTIIDNSTTITGLDAFFFLLMIFCWLVSFITSFKIRNNILIWEKILPKLDTWAQELEDMPSNDPRKSDIPESEQNNKQ